MPFMTEHSRRFRQALLPSICSLLFAGAACGDEWPRFRGTNGTGISDLRGVPNAWTENDYEWVVELPGIGHSSPVIWDDALFLTTAGDDGTRTLHRRNALTGAEVWSQSLRMSANRLHKKNSYASSTPATDGERVYIIHSDNDQQLVLAYSLGGDEVWRYELGACQSMHGQGASPIVYKELVIVPNDQEGPSSVVALNRKTGDEVWRANRPSRESSYSTPMICEIDGRGAQLICTSGITGLAGLDPDSGVQIWESGALPHRTCGCPVYGAGLLVASCGEAGVGKFMVAVDPTGQGDVSRTHVRYERVEKELLPYVPTPVVWENHLYLWCDRGLVCCVEMASGHTLWSERIGSNFSGSPVVIDGKMYCISEEGEVFVIAASTEFQLLGQSPLGDASYATPAVANGRVYFRGFGRLACLKAADPAPAGGS